MAVSISTETKPAIERAVDLIRVEPQSPSMLVDALGVSRTAVAKIQRELLDADVIEVVGKGFAGATMFGLKGSEQLDSHHATRARVGVTGNVTRERLLQAADRPAGDKEFPGLFDALLVTATGVDASTGHAIAKLQRKDGTTWVVDLENVKVIAA